MTADQPADITHLLGDFTELDDTALLARRAEMRLVLERLPPFSAEHTRSPASTPPPPPR